MAQSSRAGRGLTIGLDLGDRTSLAVVIDKDGERVGQLRVPTTRRL